MQTPNDRDIALFKMKPVASHFPVGFENGSAWTNMQFFCASCEQGLRDENVRGSVVRHSSRMAAIEASRCCSRCNTMTRFVFRIYDDMSIAAATSRGWRIFGPKPKSLPEKIRHTIQAAFAWIATKIRKAC